MWDNFISFIKLIEPLILVIVPFFIGLYLKLKIKVTEKSLKVLTENKDKNKQKLLSWQHTESIKVINRLKEVCNFYCDLNHIHTSYIQLENGTLATSKLCNMFFSCVAEDNRYSSLPKLINNIQRVPFVQLSSWFNKVSNSEHQVVYVIEPQDIDNIFSDKINVKCLVSSLVRDYKGLVIGVCNFVFDEPQIQENLDDYRAQMLKFVSSIETVFFDYNLSLENKKKELNLSDE